jgi:3-hydroxyacyl-[acyl-carrier-protein] dehydratase
MSLSEIHAAIPHRAPMLLVDEIVSRDDNSIVCRKTFHEDEYFFQGHYPNQPLVPGVILCESTVQAGAVLLASKMDSNDGKVPVLSRMNDVKFKTMVKPGDTIELRVKIDDIVSSAFYLTGSAKVNGKVAARLSFTCTMADASA